MKKHSLEVISMQKEQLLITEPRQLTIAEVEDKYSDIMYGLILSICKDTQLANDIITELFLEMHEQKVMKKNGYPLLISLLRYTYRRTVSYMCSNGEVINEDALVGGRLIHLFTTRCTSYKQAANLLNISEAEVKERLHLEFLEVINGKYAA